MRIAAVYRLYLLSNLVNLYLNKGVARPRSQKWSPMPVSKKRRKSKNSKSTSDISSSRSSKARVQSPAAQLESLTPVLCNQLQDQMVKACEEIAERHGLVVRTTHPDNSRTGLNFEFGIRVDLPLSDGTLYDPEKAMFEALAPQYGLQPEDHGRIFSCNHQLYRISGIEPRRPKYPVSAVRISDQASFKFSAEHIIRHLSQDSSAR